MVLYQVSTRMLLEYEGTWEVEAESKSDALRKVRRILSGESEGTNDLYLQLGAEPVGLYKETVKRAWPSPEYVKEDNPA